MTTASTQFIGNRPRIAVDLAGAGPAVAFLHGVGGNRTNWWPNTKTLAAEFQTVACDLRGYGASEDYEGPFRFEDAVADLARILDHLGIQGAHIVGLSLGGRIALHFRAAHPQRVRSLVLADTHLGFQEYTQSQQDKFIASRCEPIEAGVSPSDLAPKIAATLVGNVQNISLMDALVASLSAVHPESYVKTVKASVRDDRTSLAEGITVPVLALAGSQDRLTPPETAMEIARRIPNCELAIIDGAGHVSNMERPETFNRVVRSFLRRAEATHREGAAA